MSLETARQNIVTAVEAAKVAAPVSPLIIEYDNRVIADTQTQSKPYLKVHVKFMSGYQADLADSPIHRILGQIHLAACTKQGSGSADALKLLDHFYPQLHQRTLGVVRTHMTTLGPTTTHLGWSLHTALIPFWFDVTY